MSEVNQIAIESVSMWLDTVNTINKKLFEAGDISAKYFFRGQANREWPVMPSVFRKIKTRDETNIDLLDFEDLIIKEMLRISQDSFHTNESFEILTQLQHFSAPTRLIDITENPLVALYFACSQEYNWEKLSICTSQEECEYKQPSERIFYNGCENNIEFECCPIHQDEIIQKCSLCPYHKDEIFQEIKDGEIIVCKEQVRYLSDDDVRLLSAFANFPNSERSTLNDFILFLEKGYNMAVEKDYKSLVSILNTLSDYICVSPKLNNPRIQRQNGSFLICGTQFSEDYKELNTEQLLKFQISKQITDYRMKIEQKNELNERYIVKHAMKQELLNQLNILGINEGTLFPELEHQASYVKSIIHEKVRPKSNISARNQVPEKTESKSSINKIQYPSVQEIVKKHVFKIPLSTKDKDTLYNEIKNDCFLFKETDWFLFDSKTSANNIQLKKYLVKAGVSQQEAKELSDKIVNEIKEKFVAEVGE